VVDWGGCIVYRQHLILVKARAKTFCNMQILIYIRILLKIIIKLIIDSKCALIIY
jgi:hypothetical protein